VLAALLLPWAAGCRLFRPRLPEVPARTQQDLDVRTSPHRVGLVDSGWDALALRVQMIRSAERSIEQQTFIWTEDEVGKLVALELIDAARRGVEVRLISDGMHTRMSHEFAALLATASPNLETRLYSPRRGQLSLSWAEFLVDGLDAFDDLNQRAHDKVLIVDGERALIGGRNIENTYYDHAAGMNFVDREVLVEGEGVADALASFERFWDDARTVPMEYLADVERAIQAGAGSADVGAPAFGIVDLLDDVELTLLERGTAEELVSGGLLEVHAVAFCNDLPGKPMSHELEDSSALRNHVSSALGGLVRGAEESVLVQTPYLVFSEQALELLEDLREEHPDISLRASTNSLMSTDIFPAAAVTYRQARQLIEGLGVQVHQFKAAPEDLDLYLHEREALAARTGEEPWLCLHSKSVVIDGELAGVGSHNLGPRSSESNTEVMLFVWDRAFAERLTRSIERDMQPGNSWVVWRRERTPVLGPMQLVLEDLSGAVGRVTALDLWPSFYASCFELRPGAEPVPPGHPDFHANHREVGMFPGVSPDDEKTWMTRVFKGVGGFADPLL
jgi:phosphatidylserine/phosphatidylglycerophosphate/cardiolipin synthase-like enzyme